MISLAPVAQECYLFIFFCLGYFVLRSEFLQCWVKRKYIDHNNAQSKKAGLDSESISYYSLTRLREDFSMSNFEAVLEGWAVLDEYTAEAVKLLVVALLKLDRHDDVGLFVAKTLARLPALRASLPDIVCGIAAQANDVGNDACIGALTDLFDEMRNELDSATLEILLEIFANGNDEHRVHEIMSRMLSLRPSVNAKQYAKLVDVFLKKNNIDAALGFAQGMALQRMSISPNLALRLVHASIQADNAFAAEDSAESRAWTALDAVQDADLPQDALVLLLEWAAQQVPIDVAMVNKVEALVQAPMPWRVYNALVSAHAGPTGDSMKARTYFDEFAAKSCDGHGPSEDSLVGMIIACAEAKDTQLTKHMLSWAQKNGKYTLPVFCAATKVLAAAQQFSEICKIYEAAVVDGLVLDDAAYGQLINYAVQAGRVGLAWSLLKKTKNPDMLDYRGLICACGREKNLPQALELLREMRGYEAADTAAYNCVLEVCAICQQVAAAQEVFEEMKYYSCVDVVSYNTLLQLHGADSGSYTKAEALIEEMHLRGINPNVGTYNHLLEIALGTSNLRKALQILDLIESSGLAIDSHTCSIMLKGFHTQGPNMDTYSVDRVLDFVRMYKVKVDDFFVNAMVEACIRLKDSERLTGALSILEATGWKLPAQCSMNTYGTLIKAYGQSRQLPKAWKLWRELTVDRHLTASDQLFTTMIDVLINNGCMEDGLSLFQEMKARRQGQLGESFSLAYATMIRGFAQRKECQRAMQCYREMQEHNMKISLVVYNMLVDACCRVANMEAAAKLLEDMAGGQVTPDLITYSTIIKGYCLCGGLDQAIELFTHMRKQGIVPDIVLFNSILDGCARKRMRTMCEQVIHDMQEAGISPTNHTVSILVKLYGRCHDIEAAFLCFEDLPCEYGFKANTAAYTCLMAACITNNQLERAVELRQQMNKECIALDQKTYSTLLRGALRVSNIEIAIDLIHSALEQRTYGLLERQLVQNVLFLISRCDQFEQQGRLLVQRLKENGMKVSCPNDGQGVSCRFNIGIFDKPRPSLRTNSGNDGCFHKI